MNRNVKNIFEVLQQAGHEVYIVGGAVRDMILGLTPKDVDFASSATPEEVMELFPEAIPTGIDFGTVTVVMDGEGYEITTFRTEEGYADGRRPDTVQFSSSIEEDLGRRDLTINAMAMAEDGKVVDPFGGQADLRKGIVRCVGNPKERFQEDALRMMRAARFASRFGFKLEAETLRAAQDLKGAIRSVSAERIFQETTKLLMGNGGLGIEMLQEMGILEIILPEVAAMVGVGQNNPNHCYDVFRHSLKSVDAAPQSEIIRWVMLLHDTGKPVTKAFDGKKDTFHRHHEVSAKLAADIMDRMRVSKAFKREVTELVLMHDMVVPATEKSVRRLIAKLSVSFDDLMVVRNADVLAQNPDVSAAKLAHLAAMKAVALKVRSAPMSVRDLAVNGHDMMAIGLSGPKVGAALSRLLDAVLDAPSLNTKSQLLAIVQGN